ncbi:MAG: HEAT repeat domain-containing protein [Planctomycetaceae bacterium]|nr:HEAT repeat domain-containing protein [Planctomycetaceae bacterium]MBT5126558.1 HEAT repeat domain-containing protein [Planctomycetaceae bacterium]MBT5597977.1 HEAT repeat domain-containing protein [Planctomycetaceae bacterium]MBT6847734.1 HEAT repeat domain-containing protein [Planctomycetaceae bacterium]MBT7253837.1 HEAT repeat domain-containing protein [Planctomycetaceae bacterium]
MIEQPENQKQAEGDENSIPLSVADTALPEIRPPNAGFILQLFLIPMMIVAVIICVWLLFNFISRGETPTELVRGLQKMNNASWQKAYTLSSLLRAPASELKNDKELAQELIAVLETKLTEETADANQVKLRIFVCKCLGEFEIDSGLSALLNAAQQTNNANDLVIALTAVESVAVLMSNLDESVLSENYDRIVETLLAVSNEQAENPDHALRVNQLRSAAGFALGVAGGDKAIQRLVSMLDDAYPNARFNAAIGLARYGKLESTAVLLEMLDPGNTAITNGEPEGSHAFKRSVVITNAIRAVVSLSEFHQTGELSDLIDAMRNLDSSEKVVSQTKLLAKDAVVKIIKK